MTIRRGSFSARLAARLPIRAVVMVTAVGMAAPAALLATATAATAATGPGVTATIAVGGFPSDVAVDPSSHRVFAVNETDGSVSVIDESGDAGSGRVTATINVGAAARAVAVDPGVGHVYVVSPRLGTVSVIDESGDAHNGQVTATIPVRGVPYDVAVDTTDHRLYTVNLNDTLSVIDESGDAGNGKVVATIPVVAPDLIAVDSSNHNVYFAGNDDISVLNESGGVVSAKVTATIPVGFEAEGIAVDPSDHNVYVTNPDGDSMAVIHEEGGTPTGTVSSVPVGNTTWGVAADPSTHDVYVTDSDLDTLQVIDESGGPGSGKVTATIRVGGGADEVAVDPATHNVYVANSDDDTVSVIGPAVSGETAPTITGTPMPAVAGTPYAYQFAVTGFPAPYVAVTAGAAPPGLTLSSTGLLSGTATNGGTYAFTVTAANAQAPSASESVVVKVSLGVPADVSMTVSGPSAAVDGSTFTETVTITDAGPGRATNVMTTLLVPAGLALPLDPSEPPPNPVVWVDAAISPGASVTHLVTLTLAAGATGTEAIGGFAVSFASADPDLANNAAIATILLTG